jgi:hypothetical protein
MKHVTALGCTLQVLTKQAGFLEFMINRKLELERDGMDWKYAIIKNWALGGDSGAGSDTNHRKLLSYIRQGPYYRDTQPQVATQQA